MAVLELPPCRRDLPEVKVEPKIDWIVLSLFSTYGKQIHPEDKSLNGLRRLSKPQLHELAETLCDLVVNLDVKSGIRRWASEFEQPLLPQKAAA